MKWTEALNIAGSIASISGISLLWLRTSLPEVATPGLVAGSVSTIAGSLLSVGLVALAVELLSRCEKRAFVSATARVKLIYWTFSSAVSILVLVVVLVYLWSTVWAAWQLK